ncbi:MAG TPA: nitrate reductase molybdenum cofactor assembly chaperone [Candidatus Corynebacterium gallistercoris]|uniref:Nitrate reductase molybdenum cofactor assembly chaperone n=1 Tax=Candidatus Corynebacterium gallistercoris TaxID=2838530 RepID=A0A9D1RWX4_9CORY|nr:nitrate reductase molybdenum cofactor assembly chaperone [Candidatus Corynebacterium gallistercoris]
MFTPGSRNFVGTIPTDMVSPVDMAEQQRRILFMMASLLLDYPADDAPAMWDHVADQCSFLPGDAAAEMQGFLSHARSCGVRTLQQEYVETFDQRRRCSMYLSYYSVGDTRQRGTAILAFSQQLEALGFTVEREELPDHLCVVLEAAARAEGEEHEKLTEILAAHRDGIEVLRKALEQFHPGYAHVVRAVCMALPAIDQETVDNYINLIRSGPPAELVGLGTPLPFGDMERS